MNQRQVLRKRVSEGHLVVAPGAYDGLSAKIIEQAGFEATYITGGGIARSFGYPDMGLITLTEQVARVAQIADSTSLPIIADMDTGYGNALNVMRAIREMERAGASAVQLEDQVTPKRCGHLEGKEIVEVDEMIGKIHAAIEARQDPNLLLIARTDARAVEGFEGAIERCRAYQAAGADVIFLEAPRSLEEIREIPRQVDAPLLLNRIAKGAKTPQVPVATLAEWGYSIVIFPSDLQLSAIRGMQRVAAAIKTTGSTDSVQDISVTFPEREAIVGTERYYEDERRFMGKLFPEDVS